MRGTAYIAAVLLGTALFGQPRPEGADISGVWNFATLTPLERPAKFATKPSLTTEEAAAFEKGILRAGFQRLGSGPVFDEGVWYE